MKKFLLIGAALSLLSTGMYAYKVTIDNKYDGEVLLTIDQASGPNRDYLLPANRATTVETTKIAAGPLHHCIKNMHFKATSGPAKGNQTSVTPPQTGFKIRCANLTGGNFVRVLGAQDNTLVVQMPTPKHGYSYKIKNDTDRQMVAHFNVSYGSCSGNPQFLFQPKQERTIKMGLCCVSSIFFRFSSGSDPRKTAKWKSNNPCGSHSLTIEEGKDNSLVVVKK